MAQWDALAGSGATRTTKEGSRVTLREVEAAHNLGVTLPRRCSSDNEGVERDEVGEGGEEDEEDYLSEEDVRGEMLSRFDSSTVRMFDRETLVLAGPNGKKEFFVEQKQTAIKSGASE